jgi:hypothetical protein
MMRPPENILESSPLQTLNRMDKLPANDENNQYKKRDYYNLFYYSYR